MSFLRTLGKVFSGAGQAIGNALFPGSEVGDGVATSIDALFGNDAESIANRQVEKQAAINKDTALWNRENITVPNFEMENSEWDRRFEAQSDQWIEQFLAQNQEWERQWNMQNEYNTPSAMIQRMREAGINPAGMQLAPSAAEAAGGNVGGSEVSAPYTPQGAGYPAQTPTYPLIAAENMKAQTENLLATAENTRARTEHQYKENAWYDTYMTGVLRGMNSEIELNGSRKHLNEQEAAQAQANIKLIKAKANEVNQSITESMQRCNNMLTQLEGINLDNNQKRLYNEWYEKEGKEAMTKQIYSEIQRNYASSAEAYSYAKKAAEEVNNIITSGKLLDLNYNFEKSTYDWKVSNTMLNYRVNDKQLNVTNKMLDWQDRNQIWQLDWQLDKAERQWQHRIQSWEMGLNIVNTGLNALKPYSSQTKSSVKQKPMYQYSTTATPSYR